MADVLFFHTFSSGSLNVILSPNKINTTLAVNLTPSGGVPKAFISPMWAFFKQSTASLAYYKAGKAFYRATSAVSFIYLASIVF